MSRSIAVAGLAAALLAGPAEAQTVNVVLAGNVRSEGLGRAALDF